MKKNIPEPIKNFIDLKKEFFWGADGSQWKLELDDDLDFIEKIVGTPVLVFANNGYGDYLFLKNLQDSSFNENVFAFYHEGPEITVVDMELQALLGQKEQAASIGNYPVPAYETGELVAIGDKVQFKHGLLFWRGWMDGEVEYVPGISPRRNQYEYNGLQWVSIKGKEAIISSLVDPETGILRKIKLVARASANKQYD